MFMVGSVNVGGCSNENHLLTFQTCMTFFLLWTTKEDILKTLSGFVHTMEFNGLQCYLDPKILQNIVCSVEANLHTGLEGQRVE